MIGDSVKVGDLHVPEGATILDDLEATIASVLAPRRVEEELPAEEAEAAAEEAEAAAGEAAEAEAEASEG